MKKIFLRSGGGLLVGLVLLQFWPPPKNLSATTSPNDITVRHPVPPKVLALLQRACYDCHSNHTHYPWYAAVQPVGWWLYSHINEAKRHLDFSEFGTYSTKRARNKLEQITDEVDQHTMPLRSYTWMHPEARLTPEEAKLLADWADGLRDGLSPP